MASTVADFRWLLFFFSKDLAKNVNSAAVAFTREAPCFIGHHFILTRILLGTVIVAILISVEILCRWAFRPDKKKKKKGLPRTKERKNKQRKLAARPLPIIRRWKLNLVIFFFVTFARMSVTVQLLWPWCYCSHVLCQSADG